MSAERANNSRQVKAGSGGGKESASASNQPLLPLDPDDVVIMIIEDDALFTRAIAALRHEVLQRRQAGHPSATLVLELGMVGGLLDKWRIRCDVVGEDNNLRKRMGGGG